MVAFLVVWIFVFLLYFCVEQNVQLLINHHKRQAAKRQDVKKPFFKKNLVLTGVVSDGRMT